MTDEAKKLCERARERYQKGLALLMEMGPEERAQIRADIARIDRIERLTTEPSEDRVERVARAIYEHWSFGSWFRGSKPAWIDGGNSEAQEFARDFARAAIAAMPKEGWNEAIEAAAKVAHAFKDRIREPNDWFIAVDISHAIRALSTPSGEGE